jgi:predicted HD phosphohydrolase
MRMTIREGLEKLNDLIDESDPDTSLPNIVHAFQTAERAREEFPEHDWLHLIGLIHDLGKVMAFYGEFPGSKNKNSCFMEMHLIRRATVGCRWRHICCGLSVVR